MSRLDIDRAARAALAEWSGIPDSLGGWLELPVADRERWRRVAAAVHSVARVAEFEPAPAEVVAGAVAAFGATGRGTAS